MKEYFLTWAFTAVWHGFYIVYYLTFLWWFIIVEVSREISKMSAFFDKFIPYYVQAPLIVVLTRSYISYIMSAYFVIALDKSNVIYATLNHIPNIVMIILLIVIKTTGFPSKIGRKYGKQITKNPTEAEKKIQ